MQSKDGKFYKTDVADTEEGLKLVQSIPSPKAEPSKLWLAKVGNERIEEKTGNKIITEQNAKGLNEEYDK
jgi:hypothetical protein